MNQQEHLDEAEFRMARASATISADPNGAGEFVWGALIHAISAADPDHHRQRPDRFGNPHPAPVSKVTFIAAASRIPNPTVTPNAVARLLDVGQNKLHNNFYHLHLHLPLSDRATALAEGLAMAAAIVAIAKASLRPTRQRRQ